VTPTQVEIVRPYGTLSDTFTALILIAVRAWVAMIGVGILFPQVGISYWQALVGIWALDAIRGSDYFNWTKSPGWK
jgi:hypothetical protein